MWAAQNGHVSATELLAPLEQTMLNSGRSSALMYAAIFNKLECARLLPQEAGL